MPTTETRQRGTASRKTKATGVLKTKPSHPKMQVDTTETTTAVPMVIRTSVLVIIGPNEDAQRCAAEGSEM
jgi:hypothetical protein